ncbi:hypothetical protein QE152_g8761 [Popillia japonica]|uniref:Uncharacterized protein n=1 Tax=Popillia japonica TaxID=7064 RepID=A0AAW1LX26_POPJA
MLPEKFDELLTKIEDRITKNDTHMRNANPARTKVEITLRFLATGDSYANPARTKVEITLRFLATGDSYVSLEALFIVGVFSSPQRDMMMSYQQNEKTISTCMRLLAC